MKKIRFLCSILIFVCILSGCSKLNNGSKRLEYENELDKVLEEHGFVGSILIADSDGIIYEKVFEDLDITTKYETRSITKQFTTAAVSTLEREGKLSLDDNLGKYFANAGWMSEYTLRDLVNMNTLIPDYTGKADFTVVTDKTMLLNEILSYEAAFEMTGDSNSNYYLLGIIIEQVSGMAYENYIENHILIPMGFKNTEVVETDYTNFATQGVLSNVYDMYHWNNAFFGGEILSESCMSDFESQKYTKMCGLHLENGVYYGGDQTMEYASYMVYDDGVYMIMFTNRFNPAIVSYGKEVYELTMDYVE